MTQTFYPFDSGQGANVTESQWAKMAQHWLSTGVIKSVLNELQVYADSTGLRAKVKSGAAWIKGHYYESDAEEILAIGSADATNPRIDRVIVRLDWTANTVQLAVLQGVPAVSPTAPALTQNSSRWEISLAQVLVGAGVTTIAASNVTDERFIVKSANLSQENWINAVLGNGWVLYDTADPWAAPAYLKNDIGQVETKGIAKSGASGRVFTYPVGYRPKKRIVRHTVQGNNSTIRFTIEPNGDVLVDSGVINAYLSLDIPPFRAEQ